MALPEWIATLPGMLAPDVAAPAEALMLAGDAFCLHGMGPAAEAVAALGG
ncbi:hypothetical protein [Pantoea sp. 1.19]|nr:hypothetical protein [Pantoea sp. 1.19]